MAQTMERIRQYPGTDAAMRKKYMDAAAEIIRSNLPEFTEFFESSNSEGGFYLPTENVEWTTGFWTGVIWLMNIQERHVLKRRRNHRSKAF